LRPGVPAQRNPLGLVRKRREKVFQIAFAEPGGDAAAGAEQSGGELLLFLLEMQHARAVERLAPR